MSFRLFLIVCLVSAICTLVSGTMAISAEEDYDDYEETGDYKSNTDGDLEESEEFLEASSKSSNTSVLDETRQRLLRLNTLPPNPKLPVDVSVSFFLQKNTLILDAQNG